MSRSDDEALSWDGDDDPTLGSGDEPAPKRRASLPKGWRAVGRGSDEVAEGSAAGDPSAGDPAADDAAPDVEEAPAATPAQLGNAALVSFGVIAGVYLLWMIGWFLGATRLRARIEVITSSVADFMFQGSTWLAVAAPAIWFFAAWIGTRRSPLWQRFVWLAAGIVLLVPWPFVMVGVIGQ